MRGYQNCLILVIWYLWRAHRFLKLAIPPSIYNTPSNFSLCDKAFIINLQHWVFTCDAESYAYKYARLHLLAWGGEKVKLKCVSFSRKFSSISWLWLSELLLIRYCVQQDSKINDFQWLSDKMINCEWKYFSTEIVEHARCN